MVYCSSDILPSRPNGKEFREENELRKSLHGWQVYREFEQGFSGTLPRV